MNPQHLGNRLKMRWRVHVGKEDGDLMVSESPEPPVKRVKTRHRPACESGMEAPGIRHSKECRRNQENVKRSLEDLGKSTHDDSMSESKDLVDMKRDQKAIMMSSLMSWVCPASHTLWSVMARAQ